jgi:hypothetical protein
LLGFVLNYQRFQLTSRLELLVVGEEVRGVDICICGIKMVKKIKGAAILIANIFGAKRAEEHVLDGADDLLFERLVGRIVLTEERCGFVVGAIELGISESELLRGMVTLSPGLVGLIKGVADSVL